MEGGDGAAEAGRTVPEPAGRHRGSGGQSLCGTGVRAGENGGSGDGLRQCGGQNNEESLRLPAGGGGGSGHEDRWDSPGSPGEKALGDRRAGGGHRRHRPQHQPDVYCVLQGHDRPEIGQRHRVFSPPQGHCLHPESGADRIGSGAGGGRACRRGGVSEHPVSGRLSGADEGGAGAADPRHRRPRHGEGGLFLRQARHRCRRGKRPCLYPPQRGCRPCSGLYCQVKVL